MKIKKNPGADLESSSLIFFQIGLAIVLAATYFGLEWKSYDTGNSKDFRILLPEVVQEDIPITQLSPPPPPPPPPAPAVMPEVIQVIKDELELEEASFESTESSQNDKVVIVPVSEIVYQEEEEEIANVPFTVVENIPVFPGCEGIKEKEAQKKCMSQKIDALVRREFNTRISEELGLSGLNRIYVVFTINEKGEVVNIQARGPNRRLEEEAARVVRLLPRMIPGRQRDKPVAVVYSLPILYEIREGI